MSKHQIDSAWMLWRKNRLTRDGKSQGRTVITGKNSADLDQDYWQPVNPDIMYSGIISDDHIYVHAFKDTFTKPARFSCAALFSTPTIIGTTVVCIAKYMFVVWSSL